MGIAVLGPLALDDQDVTLGRRDRVVLAALATRTGRAISADRLADAVWGDTPPASAAKVLQGCVVRLRKVLGADAIQTSALGYRLALPVDDVDAHRFERMVARARELMTLGEADRAAYTLAEALALWRGPAFAELEGWDLGVVEAARLEELRLEAEELRVDACLRTGRYGEVLAEAQGMVQAAPMRERRWALLALAQYQSGRQGESLRTIHQVRTALLERLGLDPSPELAALEQAILRQDESLLVEGSIPAATGRCPYRGLSAYDIEDVEVFFGRDADLQTCLDVLRRTSTLAVVGPSGSGKSSLLRAGIAAALRREGRRVELINPGTHPVQALSSLPATSVRSVLMVDQCEEVFSLCEDPAERVEFLSALVRQAETGSLVIALRADRLADVAKHPHLARLVERGLHLLGAMADDGLRQAIESPARLSGLMVEPELVDLLVREVRDEPGALPLLSHALQETWKRREGSTLTVAGYQATGGISGAVEQSAERVYARVDPAQRQQLRDVVLRLVSPGLAGEPVRSRVPRRLIATDRDHEHLIDLLVAARLVTSDEGVVEITHEALARAWPRLRAWLDDDIEGQRLLHHLTAAADAWDTLGRPDSELYRGVRLTQALQWRAHKDTKLTDTEVAFLDAAANVEQSEQRAAEERARTQGRLIHRLRSVLGGAAVLLVAALIAGAFAVRQTGRANDNAATALAAETAAEARRVGARALAEDDIDRSMLQAVAGVRLDDSSATRRNLLAVMARRPQLIGSVPYGGDVITGLEVSPDGRSLAVYDRTSHVQLYDTKTWQIQAGHDPGEAVIPRDWFAPMAFSPDGDSLAAGPPAFETAPVRLLDADSLEPLPAKLEIPGRLPRVMDIAYSSDGSALAVVVQHYERIPVHESLPYRSLVGASVMVWNIGVAAHPKLRLRKQLAPDPVSGTYRSFVVLSPDGDTVYTSRPLSAYDVGSGSRRYAKSGSDNEEGFFQGIHYLDVSPDGKLLALTPTTDEVSLLDAKSGALRRALHGHSERVIGVRFSHDGRLLASSSLDGTAIVWDVATGEIRERLELGETTAQALAFGADDKTLYTAGEDRTIRAWDLEGSRRFVSQIVAPGQFGIGRISAAPGGRFVAHQTAGGLSILDIATGEATPFVDRKLSMYAGGWSPAGDRFAAAGLNSHDVGYIKVHDPTTAKVVVARSLKGEPADVDYSPDASRVAVLDTVGRVRLLDAESLEPVARTVQLDGTAKGVRLGPDNHTALLLTPGFSMDREFELVGRGWILLDLESGDVVRRGEVGFDASWLERSPDGRHAAIGGTDGEVVILDLATGEPLRPPSVGHGQAVFTLAYSPDGSRLVTGGAGDGSVSLWDGATGELLGTVVGPDRTPVQAEFQPDGHSVSIASFLDSVYVWDTSVDYAVQYACRLAGRDLTRAEWQATFGDRAFQEICPSDSSG